MPHLNWCDPGRLYNIHVHQLFNSEYIINCTELFTLYMSHYQCQHIQENSLKQSNSQYITISIDKHLTDISHHIPLYSV